MSGKPFTWANSVTTMLLCAACGLLLSEWWRAYLKRKHYPDLPLRQTAARYLGWIVLLGSVLTLFAGLCYRLFIFPDTFQRVNWVPTALIFWTFVFAVWTAVYIAARSMRRNGELEKERLQTQLLTHDARLAVLRQQLNPHFLFNSLNSLRALIFEDAQKASQMVDRLAALLRYSLQSDSTELVTLSEELVMVNEYLSIEKIRFEERLHIQTVVSEAASKSLLPRMLLQTLVENAVKHGIERSLSGGTVALTGELANTDLRIVVSNPGTLQPPCNSTRLGLKNAEQRLALLKGPRATLNLRQSGSDVEATVVVPQ